MRVDTVIENCQLATMAGAGYGALDDACVAIAAGRIAWVGARRDAPRFEAGERHDAAGGWITPGLVDCHTHLVHGGDRAREFELRLSGATYEEIARNGGGILSTVTATRDASEPELLAQARGRLSRMIDEGLTTVEIKSGYGLDTEGELKMLRVARELGRRLPVRVATTLLAAHALPPEYAGRPDAYIEVVVDTILPRAAREGLVDAVDAFCESIGFSVAQCERVFAAARAAGLAVKLHADQLSNQGGAALAARFGALSADHIEYSDEQGVAAMARAGTVAVLLPGAFYFLREKQLPPVQALRKHGVAIAIATDCNPGSSPLVSPLLAMNMGCTLFRLTPEEALAGMTRNAARALGLHGSIGTVEQGKQADLCLWEIRRPAELAYAIGANPLRARWFSGSSQARPAGSLE